MRRRKVVNVIETRLLSRPWDKARKGPAYGLGGDRRTGGVSLIQAFVRNMGTWGSPNNHALWGQILFSLVNEA